MPEYTDGFMTLSHRGEGRYEEKRSVFIGYALPVRTEEEALAFVKEIKSPEVADLLISLNGKAKLNAGAKPFLSVKCDSGVKSIPVLKKIFKI